jgi:hypothetical protein
VDDVVDVNYSIAIYKLKPCNSAMELTILMPAMIVGRAYMITKKFMIGCSTNKKKKKNENNK